jgi:guanylate kinase
MSSPSPEHVSSSPAFRKPLLIILSGPSGVGKDALLTRMKQTHFPLHHVVTLTTRARRATEADTIDYRFVSPQEFEDLRRKGRLLESAQVYGNWYGVPRDDVENSLRAGFDTIVKVDVQGADNIKSVMPQAVSVFLAPPTKEDLLVRLQRRSTESAGDMAVRLEAAERELARMSSFDYVAVSRWDQIDRVLSDLHWIVLVEKCQPRRSVAPGAQTPLMSGQLPF